MEGFAAGEADTMLGEEQATRTGRRLMFIGGVLTLVLAPLLFLLQTAIPDIQLSALTGQVIDVVLGFILIIAARTGRESRLTAILLSLVASVALFALGSEAGLIGGLFGIVGSLVAAAPIIQDFLKFED